MADHDHDDLYELIARLEARVSDVESTARRAADDARDAGYRADDARRAAEDVRSTAQRGW